jgi:hypothetical protein
VLQEVFAARHIRIRCGSVDVDGQAFCTGLQLLQTGDDPRFGDLLHSIGPVIYLMNGSLFRNKYPKDGALPLAALIDMYRRHEATERHDKVFALLGMSSNDSTKTEIYPDYFIPWESLLKKLTEFVLGHKVEIQIPAAGDVAIIHGGGRVCGVVRSVHKRDETSQSGNGLHALVVEVTERSEGSNDLEKKRPTSEWTLRTSANAPAVGDFIFQLDGAPQPSMIRPCGDHFAIVIAALIPLHVKTMTVDDLGGKPRYHFSTPRSSTYFGRLTTICRQYLVDKKFKDLHSLYLTYLVWDWKMEVKHAECQVHKTSELHASHGSHLEASEQAGNRHGHANRLCGSLELIADARHRETFRNRLAEMLPYFLRPFEHEDGQTTADMEKIASFMGERFLREQEMIPLRRLFLKLITTRARQRGLRVPNGMEIDLWDSDQAGASFRNGYRAYERSELVRMQRIANALADGENTPDKHKVLEAEAADEGDEDGMRLLLELWGEEVQITEATVIAAIRQRDMGVKKLELLIAQRGSDVNITEAMVVAALETNSLALMTFLFDKCGSQVSVTEDVVRTAARGDCSVEMMRLLLDRGGNQIQITENIIIEAARGYYSVERMRLLFDRGGNQVQITQNVILAAARGDGSVEMMRLLLDRGGNQVQITENMILAAARGDDSVEMMRLLFDRGGNQVQITKNVILAAARGDDLVEMMHLLLDRGGNQAQVTEAVMLAAIRSRRPGRLVRTIIEQRRGGIRMTKDILLAASEIVGGIQVISLLLDGIGENLKSQVDRREIEEAKMMNRQGTDIRKLVLERIGGSHGVDSTRPG